ncbi:MAG TPA: hypothetical protein VGB67_15395 [Fibrella sp.]
MFELNPFHLTDASLWHFLMLQGMAIIAYLLARQRFLQQQRAKLNLLQRLQDEINALRNVELERATLPEATGRDDLKEVAGVNLKIESILNSVGIHRFGQLAATPLPALKTILEEHGPLIFSFDPATWPGQAQLAADNRWAELRVWQEEARRGTHLDIEQLIREGLRQKPKPKRGIARTSPRPKPA